MTKLRLLLIWLLTPLFFGVSFATDYWQFDLYQSNNFNISNVDKWVVCIKPVSNYIMLQAIEIRETNNYSQIYWLQMWWGSLSYETCFLNDNSQDLSFIFQGNFWDHTYIKIEGFEIWDPNCSSDLISCESSLENYRSLYNACNTAYSTCSNNLQTMSWNYATCQSSLSSCQSDLLNCNWWNCDTLLWVCQENLSGCTADKTSLQNYNDSLTSQLNECLQNQGWTGSNGSGLMLVNNSLFWYYDDNLLSLPITNNLFLPLGYQGVLDSWQVLYISALSWDEPKQYYFTDEDKISIIDILSYLFIFILWIGVIFSLIKLFKKIFTH